MKKWLSWLLMLALCLSLFPGVALAEKPAGDSGSDVSMDAAEQEALPAEPVADETQELSASGTCGDNLTWTISDAGVLTIDGEGDMYDLAAGDYPWNSYAADVRTLVLGAELTSIGSAAFSGCTNIHTITFEGAAPAFGSECFAGITAEAYYPVGTGTWIKDVRMSCSGTITWCPIMPASGVLPCGDSLTWHVEGTELIISGTGDMWDYDVDTHFSPWYETDALDAVRTLVVEEGVTGIGQYAFAQGRCQNFIQNVSFPSTLRHIDKAAFWQCSINNITLPDGLETIGEEAFMLGALQGNLVIPSTVKTIETRAFWYNYLDSVTLSDNIESIGDNVFGQNNITDITFYGTMARWNELFKKSGYDVYQTTVHCTNGVILPAEKENCGEGLSWNISNGVLIISGTGDMYDFDRHEENGRTVFNTPWREQLDEIIGVVIQDGVTSIGNHAFCECLNLRWCQIPEGVTRLGELTFSGCEKLESIILPDSITTIEPSAFACSGLKTITIPAGVTCLDSEVFSDCFYLEQVIFEPAQESESGPQNAVPRGMNRTASGIRIGDAAFMNCSMLTDVTLSNRVIGIGELAFSNCSSLCTVTIPASVLSVSPGAFGSCGALNEILVDENNPCFKSNDGVLYDIDGTTLIAYPGGKEGLAEIPAGVDTIFEKAFLGCSGLTGVTIPASVTGIGDEALRDCSSLTEIHFEGSAPSFGSNSFSGITATAYYPSNDPSWTEDVCQNYGGTITWEPYGSTGSVTVTVSSAAGTLDGPTVAHVSGGGVVQVGESTTLTATALADYTFAGWYRDGELVSSEMRYTFTPTEEDGTEVHFVALYTPISGRTARLTVTAPRFTISGSAAVQRSTFQDSFPVGSQITVTFTDPSQKLMVWMNGSNKVVTTSNSYTFTLTGPMELTAVCCDAEASADEAMVVFLNSRSNSQVLVARYYSSADEIVYPKDPVNIGKTFVGWSMTEEEIRAAMATSDRILVYPKFQANGTYTVTVKNNVGAADTVSAPISLGSEYTVTADDSLGAFSYWMMDGKILGYTPSMVVRGTKDLTLTAVYNENVEAVPVITMTDAFGQMNGDVYAINFVATRSVPEGWEVGEQGLLFTTRTDLDGQNLQELLVRGGADVYAVPSNAKENNGVCVLTLGAKSAAVVHARGYMTLIKDGATVTFYSDEILELSYTP